MTMKDWRLQSSMV